VLLAAAAQLVGAPLHVAAGGLREGVVLDLLARVR
jgi:exopolyphosphatase/pppGpp-phosphohydrolase